MAIITEIFEDEDTPMPDAPLPSGYESLSLEPLTLNQKDPGQSTRWPTYSNDSTSSRAPSHEETGVACFRRPIKNATGCRVPISRGDGTATTSHSQATTPFDVKRNAPYPVEGFEDSLGSEYPCHELTVRHDTSITTVHKTEAIIETHRTVYKVYEVKRERTVLKQQYVTKRKITETFDYDPKRRRYCE
ncbi:hypothetical protein NW762_007862 [Fusarium torreyae]|uniref:Uncharacterized protein n=1 Tax=Fusarium torreyae TaxID=1237075 RepID=A0A9W8VCL2_9HYPO|nr:hypothetical protein NW762_007862 [Fusarium torreyae]